MRCKKHPPAKTEDYSKFHLQKLPVSMAELAEDAGHMGYSASYHPGCPEWEADRMRRSSRRKMDKFQTRLAL